MRHGDLTIQGSLRYTGYAYIIFFIGSLKGNVNLKDSKHFYMSIKVIFRNLSFENRSSMVLCQQHSVASDACGGSLYHHITTEVHFFIVTIHLAPATTYQTTLKFSKTDICNKSEYLMCVCPCIVAYAYKRKTNYMPLNGLLYL